MKIRRVVTVIAMGLILLLKTIQSYGQCNDLSACKAIATSGDRLLCYDSIMSSVQQPSSGEKPTYYNLGAYTVNLADPDANNYLQAEVLLRLQSIKDKYVFLDRYPELRALVIKILSKHTRSELITEDGKDKLAHEISNAACNLVSKNAGCATSMFTTFIIQ